MTPDRPAAVSPSLGLPPLDRFPSGPVDPNLLATFAHHRVRGWGAEPAAFQPVVRGALWVLLLLDLALGGWLVAVRWAGAPCSGLPCAAATLGDHPQLALALALAGAGLLIAVLPFTHGLAEAGGPAMGVVVVAALCGAIALAGVVTLFLATALALAAAVAVVLFVVDRV